MVKPAATTMQYVLFFTVKCLKDKRFDYLYFSVSYLLLQMLKQNKTN